MIVLHILLGFFIVSISLVLLSLAIALVSWGFQKNEGVVCMVCDHLDMEIEKHFNITVWLADMWHDIRYEKRQWHQDRVKKARDQWGF